MANVNRTSRSGCSERSRCTCAATRSGMKVLRVLRRLSGVAITPGTRLGGTTKNPRRTGGSVVRDTGIEPVTSSVSGKRATAAPIAPERLFIYEARWRRDSNPCKRLCRPVPSRSATPPCGLTPRAEGLPKKAPALERMTRLELATPTLARLCSTN